MPDFTFTSPEGKSYTLTGPEGATKEQAFGIFRQQHPELFQGGSGGQTGGQSGGASQPASQTQQPAVAGNIFGLGPTREQVPIRTQDMPDPGTAVLHGAIGVPVEAGRLVQRYGAQPLGWDLSKLVPPSMERGWERLTERANKGGGTQVGESVGGSLPFAGAGRAAQALPYAGRVLTRSVLPALLQPTTGPVDTWTKVLQTALGTGIGEGLQGIGWLAGTPLGKWALDQLRSKAATEREAQTAARDQLQRTMTGRASQLSETAARQAARDTEEQTRQRAYSAARVEYERQVQAAQDAERINQERASTIGQQNQRNQLDYRAAQAERALAETRRLDIPRQAVQGVLNDARGLIGLRPLEFSASRQAAPQTLRDVGGELGRVYRQMSFDPNQGGWLATAQRTQENIRALLRQDPNAQALWDRVFEGKALMPGFRAEPGVGTPAQGQGPIGTRSGPVSGDQLSLLMSQLTRAQHEFGLAAQKGGGAISRNIADGLSQMRQSIEAQLDTRFPQLAEQRRLANQAYWLTSRVMDAVDVHGIATPEALQQAIKTAEGDTRFGTDQRYADIKDRLERQHQEYTTTLDQPAAPVMIDPARTAVPVPKVGKEPSPPEPVPDITPVPLQVPRSTRVPTPAARTNERLPPEATHVAGEAASHLGRATGIPLLGPIVRGVVRHGKPALTPVFRGARDFSRATATPFAIGTSQGAAAWQRRREEERQRRRQQQRSR